MEEAAKTAKQSAESVSKGGEKLGRTAAFKALSQVSRAGACARGLSGLSPERPHRGLQGTPGLSPSWLSSLGQVTAPRELHITRCQWLTPLAHIQNPETVGLWVT